MDETFTQLPLTMDPSSKAISSSLTAQDLKAELNSLNSLHRSLLQCDGPVPAPPVPVNPKRSAQITKMRESGNASFKKGNYAEAIRMYDFGIEMALKRPLWEPSGLVREEAAGLYSNRAQAHMSLQAWPEALVDAETSLEMKKGGNSKAWWRAGKCLLEMGRPEEAKEMAARGLEFEAEEGELKNLLKDCETALQRRGSKV